MNYRKAIENYYQDRLNNNILANINNNQISKLLKQNPNVLTRFIANNVFTRDMFLEVEKYNTTLTDAKKLRIARTIIYNQYLKELYNYVAVNPELFKYYLNRKNDNQWLIKFYEELKPAIFESVINDKN